MKCNYCKKDYVTGRLLQTGLTVCDFCHDYEIALQIGAKYLQTGDKKVFTYMKKELFSGNYIMADGKKDERKMR